LGIISKNRGIGMYLPLVNIIYSEEFMWKEFKEFAFKGNVLDLAIGVIMGGAFGKIITSVVNDLIMPVLGYFMAGMDFKSLKYVMSEAIMEGETVIKPEAAILYGNFIQNIVDFLLAFVGEDDQVDPVKLLPIAGDVIIAHLDQTQVGIGDGYFLKFIVITNN